MKSLDENKDLFQAFSLLIKYILKDEEFYALPAKVLSVNKDEKTCKVEFINGTSAPIENVSLLQNNTSNGFFVVPKINSIVKISFSSPTSGYVSLFSEVEEIVFQGGNNEGIMKVLVAVQKFNALEKSINDLKDVFKNWSPVPNDGGAALKAAVTSWSNQSLTQSNKEELQNDKFKH